MARYIGPKNKLMRKVGTDLNLRTNAAKVARRLAILPGFHGRRGRRKLSDYATQLLEKQKVRILYGVMEKQFHKYYVKAAAGTENTGVVLLSLLERRLDNVVFRLGLAPTRAAARQLVSHGNVKVNDQKVTIPSFSVSIDDVITLTQKAQSIPYIAELLKQKQQGIPAWLDRKHAVGKIVRHPEREDIAEPINEQLIIEYYSR